MRKSAFVLCLLITFAFAKKTQAQELISGPLIKDFGATYTIPDPDIAADPDKVYKIVFDVATGSENPDELNLYFDTVARFLNMHAAAGVPPENLKPVLVVHGSAIFDLLTDQYYQEKFSTNNPNLPLLNQLHELGVPVILCGQTTGKRNVTKDMRWEHTKIALSAMTARLHYTELGYTVIAF